VPRKKVCKPVCDHPICVKCFEQYFERFPEATKFGTICDGIRDKVEELRLKRPDVYSVLSDDQLRALKIMTDPVEWLKYHLVEPKTKKPLNFEGRFYQEEMIRCTARIKVKRLGRRMGKTYCIAMRILHRVGTTPNSSILVICPENKHTTRIFKDLVEFLNASPRFPTTYRYVKTPSMEITFGNGSVIEFFTAGTTQRREAKGVRGGGFDEIYLDEADYLSVDDLPAIVMTVLAQDEEGISFTYSSTPDREEGVLYEKEMSDVTKLFHYPSTISPDWSPLKEKLVRDSLKSEVDYKREVLAEYPSRSSDYGFSMIALRKCRFNRDDMPPETQRYSPSWRYVIGVDSNQNVPDMITVLAMPIDASAVTPLIWVCEIIQSSSETMQQKKTVEKIIELVREWQTPHVFIDKGYSYGLENDLLLRARAFRSNARWTSVPPYYMQLEDHVKCVDFGSRVPVKDLQGNIVHEEILPGGRSKGKRRRKPRTKQIKSLISEIMFRLVDNLQFGMPVEEVDLFKQMVRYKKTRENRQTRERIYEVVGGLRDDELASVMVAVWGMWSTFIVGTQIEHTLVKVSNRPYSTLVDDSHFRDDSNIPIERTSIDQEGLDLDRMVVGGVTLAPIARLPLINRRIGIGRSSNLVSDYRRGSHSDLFVPRR
jgi:hypothetical protein